MIDQKAIREARHALGQQLALLRQSAGLSQLHLGAQVHFSRSTVANVEIGRIDASQLFWERIEAVLTNQQRHTNHSYR